MHLTVLTSVEWQQFFLSCPVENLEGLGNFTFELIEIVGMCKSDRVLGRYTDD